MEANVKPCHMTAEVTYVLCAHKVPCQPLYSCKRHMVCCLTPLMPTLNVIALHSTWTCYFHPPAMPMLKC